MQGSYDHLLALNTEGVLTAENLAPESDDEDQKEKKAAKPKARKPRAKKTENKPLKTEIKQNIDPVLSEDSPSLKSTARKRPQLSDEVKPPMSEESPPVKVKMKKLDSFEDNGSPETTIPVMIDDSPPPRIPSTKRPKSSEEVKPSTSMESPPVGAKVKKLDSFEDNLDTGSPETKEDSSGVDSQGWQVYDPRDFEEQLKQSVRRKWLEIDDNSREAPIRNNPAASSRNSTPGM